jgi:hypothetical protein
VTICYCTCPVPLWICITAYIFQTTFIEVPVLAANVSVNCSLELTGQSGHRLSRIAGSTRAMPRETALYHTLGRTVGISDRQPVGKPLIVPTETPATGQQGTPLINTFETRNCEGSLHSSIKESPQTGALVQSPTAWIRCRQNTKMLILHVP